MSSLPPALNGISAYLGSLLDRPVSPFVISVANHGTLLVGMYIGAIASGKVSSERHYPHSNHPCRESRMSDTDAQRFLALQALMAVDPSSDNAETTLKSAPLFSRERLKSAMPLLIVVVSQVVLFAAYQLSNRTTWIDIIPTTCYFFFFLMSVDGVRHVQPTIKSPAATR